MMTIQPIKFYVLIFSISTLLLISCSKDEPLEHDPFVVAFENLSKNLMDIDEDASIGLVYSETAQENGLVSIKMNTENAIYGQDFTTSPEAINNIIMLPVLNGDAQNSITFKKLVLN